MISHTAVEANPENNSLGPASLNTATKAKKINPAKKGGMIAVLQNVNVIRITAAL